MIAAMEFKERLNKALTEANKTQTELADFLDISPQSVQQWSAGKSTPKNSRIASIAGYLGCDRVWLQTGISFSPLQQSEFGSIVPDSPPPLLTYEQVLEWSETGVTPANGEAYESPIADTLKLLYGDIAIVKIVTDSMEPEYKKDCSYVAIVRSDKIDEGKLDSGFLIYKNTVVFASYREQGPHRKIIYQNPDWENRELTKHDRVIADCVCTWREK